MRNKLIVVAVAITMVTMVFPASQARHLSVGVRDSVAVGAQESPDNPSVPGPDGDQEANDTPYEVGTTDPDHCFQRTEEISADNAQEAATKNGFCGRLIYNHDSSFELVSPPDQHFVGDGSSGPIPAEFPGGPITLDDRQIKGFSTFDIVRTWVLAPPIGFTCDPFCDSPGQNATWNAAHTVGSELGVTDNPEDAHDNETSERTQFHTYRIDHAPPNAIFAAAGPWAMDGWTLPAPYASTFVGFLKDTQGNVVSDNDLETIVSELQEDGVLTQNAIPTLCGVTPDRSFQSTGEQGSCDDNMNFVNTSANPDPTSSPEWRSYEEECGSPTYICGPTQGEGYWESDAAGLLDAYAARYQGEFMRWHYFIAGTPQTCGNAEPGINPYPATQDNKADLDYLGHELDVYVPAHHFETGGTPASTSNTIDYAETIAYAASEDPEQVAAQTTPGSGILPPTIDSITDEATAQNVREDLIEPNLGDATADLDDTSQAFALERSQGACESLTLDTGHHSPPSEPEQEIDPWTNIIDAGVDANREASYRDPVVDDRTPFEAGRDTPTVGFFGTEGSGQDADNDPTPSRYTPVGSVGVFMDGDDDGQYERVTGPADSASSFGAGVYDSARIQSVGAYPMLWDMHVTENDNGEPVVDTSEGCNLGGAENEQFTDWMVEAGYGANTSLVQAIYLRGPTEFTVVTDDGGNANPDSVQYPTGNNIYLLMNQAGHQLWNGTAENQVGVTDNPVDGAIDSLLVDLVDYLETQQGVDLDLTNDVQVPNNDVDVSNLDSDYTGQCDQSTGDFTSEWSFTHQCAAAKSLCEGDTIATLYTYEVDTEDGTLGGDENVPPLTLDADRTDTNSEGAYKFSEAPNTWIDVDPFDGDPARNDADRANAPSDWCPTHCD